jgi:hypothetical protein
MHPRKDIVEGIRCLHAVKLCSVNVYCSCIGKCMLLSSVRCRKPVEQCIIFVP